MDKSKIIYKHLWCWDRFMGSFEGWSLMMQQRAVHEQAPLDAIYHSPEKGWVRFSEVKFEAAKEAINQIMQEEFNCSAQ